MKVIYVAFKDLKRVFRSAFALIMMFGAPLLLAGLLYFAFGGMASGDGSFTLPRTKVVIVNLDKPDASTSTFRAGETLIEFLQNKDLADVLEITMASDEASACSAVDDQKADVALIIPPNFTQVATTPAQEAAVILYQDPTLTIGPGIVKDLVNHFMDGFSGAKIAAKVAVSGMPGEQSAPDLAESAMLEYVAYLNNSDHEAALQILSPSGETGGAESGLTMIGPIMASMLVLFVFFMGANGAQSIIREQEEGTLARLFTTPVPQVTLLSGKFLGIFVTLVIQSMVLLVASALVFHISWGKPLPVALATLSLIIAATGFGVMLMSFIKSSRQTGPILGGVLTLTGMLGGLFTNGIPNVPEVMDTISLSMPQGWALHAWKLCLAGNSTGTVLFPVLVLTALGVLFFLVGLTLFRRRFG